MNSSNAYFPDGFAEALRDGGCAVEVQETHISWIFLTDRYAYKVKKPVKNAFLDYSTLELRRRYCGEELRLDKRYAKDLYLSVVRITHADEGLRIDTQQIDDQQTVEVAAACEYAVKMRRFPAQDLLSQRLEAGRVSVEQVTQFAIALANFHQAAAAANPAAGFGSAEQIRQDALDNLQALENVSPRTTIADLKSWTLAVYEPLAEIFKGRQQQAKIRECHGDLHTGNIVWWQGRFVPFDGIEFNDSFRWIDILSDAAFLAMDLRAVGHTPLAYQFINSYLEQTGDYRDLQLLRWYMVYRALVRAKVAELAMRQHDSQSQEFQESCRDREQHIQLAAELTTAQSPSLHVMHGLSGSGKSTVAERIVGQFGAIRLRADVERKRLWDKSADYRPSESEKQRLYSPEMTARTYDQLETLARRLMAAGYSVVVDATFLKQKQRQQFHQLANELTVPFCIVDCTASIDTLRDRLRQRVADGSDASDADLQVLDHQLQSHEPLLPEEQQFVIFADADFP